jgi:transcriptional regulator with XRE-family HTH domain
LTNLLAIIRRKKSITQRQLADALAVSPSYLCRIEKGSLLPTDKFIDACVSFFSMNADELFPGSMPLSPGIPADITFVNSLWSVRKEKKIKQNDLARLLGCSPSYLSRVEQGKLEPGPEFRKKCARVLKKKEKILFPEP